ncbi:MAG: alpha/beta hydrolase [Planctomycetes bacterium]|nr:alpha/beta hydrolase [Planctomycetota bacterium]
MKKRLPAFLWKLLKIAAVVYIGAAALLFIFQGRLIFPAQRGGARDPRDAGLASAEVLEVHSHGAALHGYILYSKPPGDPPGPALLFFHGNAENVTMDAGWLGELRKLGLVVAEVDYPGYGLSEGSPDEGSLIDSGIAALAALRANPAVDAHGIVLLGSSLGSGVAVAVAARENVAGVILQSPFDSLVNVAMLHYPIFPRFLVRTPFDSRARIAGVQAPMLFMHGDRDSIVPLANGRALAAAARNVREFHVVNGAGHNDLVSVAGERYFAWIREFVREVTASAPAVPR